MKRLNTNLCAQLRKEFVFTIKNRRKRNMVRVKRPKLGIPSIMRTFGSAFQNKKKRIHAKKRCGQQHEQEQRKKRKIPIEKVSHSVHTISIPFGGMNKMY